MGIMTIFEESYLAFKSLNQSQKEGVGPFLFLLLAETPPSSSSRWSACLPQWPLSVPNSPCLVLPTFQAKAQTPVRAGRMPSAGSSG